MMNVVPVGAGEYDLGSISCAQTGAAIIANVASVIVSDPS
jgi:hypothetical protein